jgi:DegV family protein with EDD domain
MIKIITDSTSYIPNNLLEKYDIDVISLSVILGDEIITETQISNTDFFEKLDKSEHHPTSSQPPVQTVYDVFESYIQKGDSIVCCFISSKMSGTCATAQTVKKMILEKYTDAKIEIVDSESNCMQLGFATLAGAKAAKDGTDIDGVVSAIKDNIGKSRMLFIPKNLDYLQRSGRLSKASALAASLLKIYPILTVIDGSADVYAKVRTHKKALAEMVNTFAADIKAAGLGEVFVVHIDDQQQAEKFKQSLSVITDAPMDIGSIGPVIGAHVGPGTVGLVYYTK